MCNKINARRVVGNRTEEQLLTLSELMNAAHYLHMAAKMVIPSGHFKHGGPMQLTLAPEESYFGGRYTWYVDIRIEADGNFTIEGADEVVLDELDTLFDRVDDRDPFVKGYAR
jgi:hypothetical protein